MFPGLLLCIVVALASTPQPALASDMPTSFGCHLDQLSSGNTSYILGNEDGVFGEVDRQFNTSAMMPVFSASKLVTSATIMTLVERGLLSLDETVSSYLDWWTNDTLTDPRANVTLRYILSQTAGFGDHDCATSNATTPDVCAREIYDDYGILRTAFCAEPPCQSPFNVTPSEVEPGMYFMYAESNFVLAGVVASAVTNLTWNEVFRQQIGDPLGMSPGVVFGWPSFENPDPGGGMFGSGEEYSRFLLAYYDGTLLNETSTDAIETPWTREFAAEMEPMPFGDTYTVHYGLGSWINLCRNASICSEHTYMHSIGAGGFLPWVDRDLGYWGIVVNNVFMNGTISSMYTVAEIIGNIMNNGTEVNCDSYLTSEEPVDTSTHTDGMENEILPTSEAEDAPASFGCQLDHLSSGNNTYMLGNEEGVFGRVQRQFDTNEMMLVWSASKLVTAATIMTLVESDLLSLDEPVSTYLDWWTDDTSTDPRANVTLRYILSQTAGFGNHECAVSNATTPAACAREIYEDYGSLFPIFCEVPPCNQSAFNVTPSEVEPGMYFVYAESNFVLAGVVASAVTNLTWNEVFRLQIGDPLGMSPGVVFGWPSFDNPDPGGGMFASGEEFTKFLLAYYDGTLLSAESTDLIETPWTQEFAAPMDIRVPFGDSHSPYYGLGSWIHVCDNATICGEHTYMHSMGAGGFMPFVDREYGYWGIVVNNDLSGNGTFSSLHTYTEIGSYIMANGTEFACDNYPMSEESLGTPSPSVGEESEGLPPSEAEDDGTPDASPAPEGNDDPASESEDLPDMPDVPADDWSSGTFKSLNWPLVCPLLLLFVYL